MSISHIVSLALLSFALALPQTATGASNTLPSSRTALPITFTKTVSADHARAGDVVHARTTQAVKLASGELLPAGTEVFGHVAVATAFIHDKTPYATQRESVLEIQFDLVHSAGRAIPLKATIRAMADPLTSWSAREPKSSDLDPLGTVTQIGGDELTPSQSEVVNRNGDVVAYRRSNGVYAHLIAHAGCDASTNEVSVGIYSASACGLYGFTDVVARDAGSAEASHTLSLTSVHISPKIWRHSTALLEVLPEAGATR